MSVDPLMEKEWSPTGDGSSRGAAVGRLVSYTIPAPGLSLANFLKEAEGQPRFFWQRGRLQEGSRLQENRGEDALYAGFGTAVQLMAWGEGRFQEIEEKARRLFEGAQILGKFSAPILPRLFGGFSFGDDFTAENAWTAFHPAHFVLPHYQLVQNGEMSWLTINALVPESEHPADTGPQLGQALQARYRYLLEKEPNGSWEEGETIPHDANFEIRYPMSSESWSALVTEAIETMDRSALNKVVLARVCEIKSKSRIDVCRALSFLNSNYEGCTRFLFEPRPHHAFYGATPEILVKVAGKEITTMALAGSKPRGRTAEEDQKMANELLTSAKEHLEHQLVVQAILRRLEPITSQLEAPPEPGVLRLSYIQHLLTPITGILNRRSGILPLVQLLHPTPAMGGSPRELAMAFIKEYEPVPRGWYAAPFGWLDSEMDGEFVVAIRSAVAQERRVWCYAGAGIVPDSQPEIEWQETGLKLRPMLRALSVTGDQ